MNTEEDIGVTLLQCKKFQRQLATTRSQEETRKDSSLDFLRGSTGPEDNVISDLAFKNVKR